MWAYIFSVTTYVCCCNDCWNTWSFFVCGQIHLCLMGCDQKTFSWHKTISVVVCVNTDVWARVGKFWFTRGDMKKRTFPRAFVVSGNQSNMIHLFYTGCISCLCSGPRGAKCARISQLYSGYLHRLVCVCYSKVFRVF